MFRNKFNPESIVTEKIIEDILTVRLLTIETIDPVRLLTMTMLNSTALLTTHLKLTKLKMKRCSNVKSVTLLVQQKVK